MPNVFRAAGYIVALVLLQLVSVATAVKPTFENSAIVRTVELGGSLTYVSTTYAVKSLKEDTTAYIVSISEHEHETTSWIQAKIKGQAKPLEFSLLGHDHAK